jgi:hypothetical protein
MAGASMHMEDHRVNVDPPAPRPTVAAAATATEPDRSTRKAGDAFVGRVEELASLRAALDAASAGRGRLVLVGG